MSRDQLVLLAGSNMASQADRAKLCSRLEQDVHGLKERVAIQKTLHELGECSPESCKIWLLNLHELLEQIEEISTFVVKHVSDMQAEIATREARNR